MEKRAWRQMDTGSKRQWEIEGEQRETIEKNGRQRDDSEAAGQ
jgi:hypothetical protein